MIKENNHITIMDGGMGRLLEEMGAPFKQPEWSALALMQAPEFVSRAHDAYVEAGAEILITNSYAVVPFHIGQERFDTQGRDLIKLSAQLARQSADNAPHKVLVAGSIPPAFGSYRAELYIEEKAERIYRPLIEEQAPYVDLWLAETVSTVKEVQKISQLLKENSKPLWVSYTIVDRQGEKSTPLLRSGETIEQAVHAALQAQAKAILFNCSQPEEMKDALSIIQKMNIDIPYGAYANAFVPITESVEANSDNTSIRDDTDPDAYLKFAQKWKDLGATIIGGCCGIGPEHIKALHTLNH
ncbi:MAG TPA: homocysteine S-methyltransferase family protein [Alphaproteobacteria bacterium]|nr:homocysteine S-methyltransferase family protein [Alphaproteobacteria bacterium]